MTATIYPDRYLIVNSQQTKQLNVVLKIDGFGELFSLVPVYERIRYGDPRIHYGDPGIVYGGLILKEGVRAYLQIESGLTIAQKIEPEQGRGSISTLTLSFIDKDGFMSQFMSPGVTLTEPLGGPLVEVFLGYANTSYPDDYFVVFRGNLTDTTSQSGKVTLQISDANFKRRKQIARGGMTKLSSGINSTTTTIPVNSTSGFFQQILGPDGTYDTAVKTYIKVEDEWMTYGPTGITSPTSFTTLSRGGSNSRGTSNVSHDPDSDVSNGCQIQDNVVNTILKISLSGWGGNWIENVTASAVGTTVVPGDPRMNVVVFPVDVLQVYGLTAGDWVTITGSGAGNDGVYQITSIEDQVDDSNRLVFIDTSLAPEAPFPGSVGFRSKYDTLPLAMGLRGTPREIDVPTHESIRDQFLTASQYTVQLFFQEVAEGKKTLEQECYLPFGLYSITRYGKVSMAITRPPIADEKLTFLSQSNIIDPMNILVKRALNNRRFFNLIAYEYDKADNGSFESVLNLLDTDSLNNTEMVSTLPIQSGGLKTSLGGAVAAQSRGTFLLKRFKDAAYELTLKVLWGAGSLIEIGDVVAVQDEGTLKITNLEDGTRNLGTQLFEVIGRSVNVKEGNVTLTLLSNLGYKITDRYATIAPSSLCDAGSTTTRIKIKDSFGAKYPGNEKKKWERLFGSRLRVHSYDWTSVSTTTLISVDPVDPYALLVDPPLSFTPAADDIVDLDAYGTGTDPSVNATAKTLFTFMDPTLTVVTGISNTQFTVSAGDALKINEGQVVQVHNADYSISSPEVKVTSLVGVTVTVASSLGFTPSAGQKVEFVGFKDGGGPYRIL